MAGCGSVITLNEDCVCHKLWEPSECSQSSTWRELAAIDFSLESFAPILKGLLVKWVTDRQTAAEHIACITFPRAAILLLQNIGDIIFSCRS